MTLYWNDPDPVQGTDYEVNEFTRTPLGYRIVYNDWSSEAEIPEWELTDTPPKIEKDE